MTPKALLQAHYDAVSHGDAETMLACTAEDAEHHVNRGGVRHGRDAFRDFYYNLQDWIAQVSR